MHKNCRDTAILIDKIPFIGHDYVKIKVTHVNLGYSGKPWVMNGPKYYKIYTNEYANYIELSYKQLYTLRTIDGIPNEK